jgi:hypothetical protein
MGRQDVDDHVQALARRIAAHRRRPDGEGGEAGRTLLLQDALAFGLVPGVVGQRRQRHVLGHVAGLDAVDRGRRGVDEPFDPGGLGGAHKGAEGVQVDGLAQGRVQLERRVVGDAGQVDDGVAALKRLRNRGRVADVGLDAAQAGMMGDLPQHVFAIEEQVEDGDGVACLQQCGGQDAADIAGAAGHQHGPGSGRVHPGVSCTLSGWGGRRRPTGLGCILCEAGLPKP